jgi:drug/metabolite transporter (DMT)-like permease
MQLVERYGSAKGGAVDKKAAISGLLALPGIAAVTLWLVSFSVPSLLSRDDLIPLYLAVLFPSVLALPMAAVWRWQAGASWHAKGALLVNLVTQVFNCCGFFYCIGKVAGSLS